ncbi:MAG: ABC transporter permease [Variibacter sp.]|nr:ABC transporter permease [Variibacter sp.]
MTSVETRTDALVPSRAAAARPRRPRLSAENATAVNVSRIVFAVMALGAWELGADRLFDPFFFSTPSRIFAQVAHELVDPGFYADLGVTAFEMLTGFAVGAGAGITLGVLLARWAFAAKVLDPFLLALYSIPRIALAPMLIVWFGIGYSSKIFLGATLVFFITFFNTLAGIRSVDPALCNVARVMKATEWQVFWKVMLPSASSWILTSVKVSLPFALVGVILGEFLVASQGLGYRLNAYSTSYNITGALAVVFLMMVIMLVLTAATNAVEARVLRWRPKASEHLPAQS